MFICIFLSIYKYFLKYLFKKVFKYLLRNFTCPKKFYVYTIFLVSIFYNNKNVHGTIYMIFASFK